MRPRCRKPALELAYANWPDEEPLMSPGGKGVGQPHRKKCSRELRNSATGNAGNVHDGRSVPRG